MSSLTQRLDELDALKASGRISETEYQQARAAALSGPQPTTGQAVAAEKCRKNHNMLFGVKMTVPTKHGEQEVQQVVCSGCFFLIPQDELYFHCKECRVAYCETCVATSKVSIPPSNWHSGLMDWCADGGICADSFFCNYCFQTHVMCFQGLRDGKAADEGMCCRDICCSAFLLFNDIFFLFTLSSCLFGGFRARLTEMFNIEPRDDCCGACCVHFFCRPCSVAQAAREMKARNLDQGGFLCASKAPIAHRPPRISAMGGSVSTGAVVAVDPYGGYAYNNAPAQPLGYQQDPPPPSYDNAAQNQQPWVRQA